MNVPFGSFIIMAILGGAILVPLQGWIIDQTDNVNISYLLPLFCFTVVLIFSIFARKKEIAAGYVHD